MFALLLINFNIFNEIYNSFPEIGLLIYNLSLQFELLGDSEVISWETGVPGISTEMWFSH